MRFYRISSPGYQINALLAVYKNDGEAMLKKVLHELGLESTLDLMKAINDKGWQK